MNTNIATTAIVVLTYLATSMFGNFTNKQNTNNSNLTAKVLATTDTKSPLTSSSV